MLGRSLDGGRDEARVVFFADPLGFAGDPAPARPVVERRDAAKPAGWLAGLSGLVFGRIARDTKTLGSRVLSANPTNPISSK